MKMKGSLILLMLLTGCATHITESGRKINVVDNSDFALLKNCERLGRIRGEAVSFLSNGEYGVIYATNDARNKAARIPHADTLEIINNEPKRWGGEITGIVYNCLAPRTVSAQPALSVPPQRKDIPVKIMPSPKPLPKDFGSIFEKAKKCQNKGGVWVNDTCIIQID